MKKHDKTELNSDPEDVRHRGPCEIIAPVVTLAHRQAVFAIRNRVFVEEQEVDPAHERDEFDETAHHVLGLIDGVPAGTGRGFIHPEHPSEARVGRMAVLPEFRGRRIASRILAHLLDWARNQGKETVRLHAQCAAIPLYARFGFIPIGERFMEEGIEHLEMILRMPDRSSDERPPSS